MSAKLMNTNVDIEERAFLLAIAVIQDRIRRMSKADRDDLFELIPVMLGDDGEERESACVAVHEILSQSAGKVILMPMNSAPLRNWTEFVSKKLRDTREEKGITQEELATKSGLQQSYISRLEKGEHNPTRKTLKKLADALGTDVSTFDPSA